MAITTFQQDVSAFFPAGTSLEARPASNWPAHKRPPEAGTAPLGSATATAVSAATGVVTFAGLADSTEYYVSDSAGTRYVRITTFPPRQELMTTDLGESVAQLDGNGKLTVSERPDSVVNVDDYLPAAANLESAIASAVTAATAGGRRGTVRFNPLTDYTLGSQPFRMLRNSACPGVRFEGRGARLKACSDGRCVDISKVADHDTFEKYTWHDFVFDGRNIAGDVWRFGTTESRVNLKNIGLYDCTFENVPTDATGATQPRCFDIGISHPTDSEGTRDVVQDITLWNVRCEGGNYGAILAGSSQAGVLPNILLDRLLIVDFYHDTGIAPSVTGFAGAGIQIGVTALVDNCWIVRPRCFNSGDVSIEADNVQYLVIDTPLSKDPRDGHYLTRNFRPPLNIDSQVNILLNPKALNENFAPTLSDESRGYNIQGTEPFGHLILVNPTYVNRANSWIASRGQALHTYGAAFKALTIVGTFTIARVGMSNVTLNANAQDFVIASTVNGCLVNIDTILFKRRGSATGNVTLKGGEIRSYDTGAHTIAHVGKVIIDNGLTGAPSNANTRWMLWGGGGGKFTLKVDREFYMPGNSPNDTQPKLNDMVIAAAGISGRLEFENVDSTNAPSTSAVDFNFQNADAKPFTFIRKWTPRTGFPIGSAAITPGASPYAYQNLDGYREQVVVQGGTVSKIELGRGTPAYVDAGVTAGVFVLDNGDYLRVTYTVAPTMTKIPLD